MVLLRVAGMAPNLRDIGFTTRSASRGFPRVRSARESFVTQGFRRKKRKNGRSERI